ncbi:MAG: GNAT family N-acetyltransferase [Victivallaceae bacterium]|nr:GNAT family N-acetyltransferase [Victivallaceae bacterium]
MSENVTITELLKPEELVEIRQIAAVIWPETFRTILSGEQIAYMIKMMYDPSVMERELADGFHFALLRIDGVAAGYCSWSAYRPGAAKLHKVYLLSNYHFRGYGRMMIEYVASRCRRDGFCELYLNVNKRNLTAQAAYRRRGFEAVEAVSINIGNGYVMDDFVMRLAL